MSIDIPELDIGTQPGFTYIPGALTEIVVGRRCFVVRNETAARPEASTFFSEPGIYPGPLRLQAGAALRRSKPQQEMKVAKQIIDDRHSFEPGPADQLHGGLDDRLCRLVVMNDSRHQ